MTVSFHNFKTDENCSVCLDKLTGQDAVAHNNMHSGHRECLKEWAVISATCPICRAQLDVNSLLTWKDKVIAWKDRNITELKDIAIDALPGAALGAIVFASRFIPVRIQEAIAFRGEEVRAHIIQANHQALELIARGANQIVAATGLESTASVITNLVEKARLIIYETPGEVACAALGVVIVISVTNGLLRRRGLPHLE